MESMLSFRHLPDLVLHFLIIRNSTALFSRQFAVNCIAFFSLILGILGDRVNQPSKYSSKFKTIQFIQCYALCVYWDDVFGLKSQIMKPYPLQNLPVDKRVFNYRLSHACRVVENVFGIAAACFRIFRRPIIGRDEKVVVRTKAVVALHNFLMSLSTMENNYINCPSGYAD